jgi:hypothetical protein
MAGKMSGHINISDGDIFIMSNRNFDYFAYIIEAVWRPEAQPAFDRLFGLYKESSLPWLDLREAAKNDVQELKEAVQRAPDAAKVIGSSPELMVLWQNLITRLDASNS